MLPSRVKRTKSPEEARASLMRLCARAEKSTGDALRLMRSWGVEESAQQTLLAKLIEQRFIDDVRFAEAFVREKVRLNGWGAYKIRTALHNKGIAKELIDDALQQTNRTEMTDRLRSQLERKSRTTKHTTQYELRTKLIRYGLSLGYDYQTVTEIAAELVKETEECNDLF